MNELAQKLKSLFRGPKTHYGQFWVGDDLVTKMKAVTRKEEIPDEAWVRHVEGRNPGLGVSPLMESGNCYWGAIDWDDQVDVYELERRVQELEFPLVVCSSKSGGAHLYVFLSAPVTADMMREKLRLWSQTLNIRNETKSHKLEIFPKQSSDALGNWINLPYFASSHTNRFAVRAGQKLTLEEFVKHCELMRVSDTRFRILHTNDPGAWFADGPPCLETLHREGVGDMRNITLTNIAIYLKHADPDRWQERLHAYNEEHVSPPLERSEVDTIAKSVDGKDYWYQCSIEPMCSNCDKGTCLKRKFGVGLFQTRNAARDLPPIESLVWIKADPARWRVTVDGNVVEVTTEQLTMGYRFKLAVMEKLGVFLPSVKQGVWEDLIKDLMLTRMTVEAPEEIGVGGRFMRLLGEFAEMRKGSTGLSDLRRNKPVQDEGDVVFRYEALEEFLSRNRFTDWDSTDVWSKLKTLGAVQERRAVDKKTIRVWRIPASVIAYEDTDEIIPTPRGTKEPTF